MKYLESLKKRELSVGNLPKSLQKKIKELDYQINTLKEIESLGIDGLKDPELADIKIVKASIEELDNHIAHKVNIFDQAKYDEKLAKISKMTKAKQGTKEVEEVEKQEVEVKEPEIVEQVVFGGSVQIEEEPKLAPELQSKQEPQPAPQPTYVAPPPTPQPAPIYEEQHEEEEFERKGEGKPKKMTTGILLMGVGAFFLTWGAVNFFKSRR